MQSRPARSAERRRNRLVFNRRTMPTQPAPSAFQVHASDNVATLLGEAAEGSLLTIVGPAGKREIAVARKD